MSWSPLSAGARHVLAGEIMSVRLVPIGLPREDRALQAKLLGVVHDEESTSFAEEQIA